MKTLFNSKRNVFLVGCSVVVFIAFLVKTIVNNDSLCMMALVCSVFGGVFLSIVLNYDLDSRNYAWEDDEKEYLKKFNNRIVLIVFTFSLYLFALSFLKTFVIGVAVIDIFFIISIAFLTLDKNTDHFYQTYLATTLGIVIALIPSFSGITG